MHPLAIIHSLGCSSYDLMVYREPNMKPTTNYTGRIKSFIFLSVLCSGLISTATSAHASAPWDGTFGDLTISTSTVHAVVNHRLRDILSITLVSINPVVNDIKVSVSSTDLSTGITSVTSVETTSTSNIFTVNLPPSVTLDTIVGTPFFEARTVITLQTVGHPLFGLPSTTLQGQ